MSALLNLAALAALGISVGVQWGTAPAVAAVAAVWLLMPYNTVGTVNLR